MIEFAQYFVDGRWVDTTGTAVSSVFDPVSEARIGATRSCSSADLDRALNSARAAFGAWRHSALDQRREALRKLRDALAARSEAFVQAFATEIGLPVYLGRALMVPMPLANLDAIIDGLDAMVWTERIRNTHVSKIPVGVVAAITPWNAPLHQIVAKVAGAIGAGCTVVLKPSELAPAAARLFAEAIIDSGLPPGVFNLVWGEGGIGEYLVTHRDVDFISFTGSRATGAKVIQASADRIKRAGLELGGKSAAVVLEDADLEQAVAAVFGQCMSHSGQVCVAQSRLIVPRRFISRAEELIHALAAGLKIGDPQDDSTRLGPVANARQFDRVNTYIGLAQEQGARRVTGGSGRANGFECGFFIAPTVFSGVTPAMTLAQEEVFGPVLALMGYDTEDDALHIANASRYGLSGAVWSSDQAHAEAFANAMHTGQVIVNGAARNLAAPFGGLGESGFGRENGRFSIEAFLELKAVQLPV